MEIKNGKLLGQEIVCLTASNCVRVNDQQFVLLKKDLWERGKHVCERESVDKGPRPHRQLWLFPGQTRCLLRLDRYRPNSRGTCSHRPSIIGKQKAITRFAGAGCLILYSAGR